MGKKIVIAGGGHGGIAVGMLLAQNGFEVEIYEKNKANEMGYDWTDIFNPRAFKKIGLPLPPEEMYEYKTDMTFYATSENTAVEQHVPESEREIKMERRDIYKYIIGHAEKAGVKLVFQKPQLEFYSQRRGPENFEPGLSIIDVMMFNSPADINKMLDKYELITKSR